MRLINALLLVAGMLIYNFTAGQQDTLISAKIDTLETDTAKVLTHADSVQVTSDTTQIGIQTTHQQQITFNPSEASGYIVALLERKNLWVSPNDTLRTSLARLIDHYIEPYDSIRSRILRFPFDSSSFAFRDIFYSDTLQIRWLNSNSFIIDTTVLEKNPLIEQKTIVVKVLDPTSISFLDIMPDYKDRIESILQHLDTTTRLVIDTAYLDSKGIKIYHYSDNTIKPSLCEPNITKPARFTADSSKVIITKSKMVTLAGSGSPYLIVPNDKMIDSLKNAVETLTSYNYKRDSILINLNGKTPYWLTGDKSDLYRYWVKNSKNDSITIWIGNPSKHDLSLALEEDVNVGRLEKRPVDDITFTSVKPERSLAKLKPLKEIPIYWDYEMLSSYTLNQNYLSNWVRGGESSLASLLDINTKLEYNNREAKTKWINTGRIRYSTTRTKEQGFRTNTDIIEINSQFNKTLRDKIDFSSVLYMKSQVAKGYNYPSNAPRELKSKFLNPGSFTVGLGLEYKPNSKTTFNLSPISYRNTFVIDTASINQTVYGIDPQKKAKQEMGGQLVVTNKMTFLKDLEISNTIRLFSSYLEKPENVDVDWEMGIEKQISLYFKVRLNLHLIYDDDIRFPLMDSNNQPILLPDGTEKKVAKAQFNQLLGLTLAVKI